MKKIQFFLINVRRKKIWFSFLIFVFLPIYNLIWEYIINFHGKLLYYFWLFRKKEFFNFSKNSTLIVKNEKNFIDLANSIKEFFPEKKIENIISKNKKTLVSNKTDTDLTDFKFNINNEISPILKEKILNFVFSDKNLSTASNYLKVFPIVSLVSLHLNVPVDDKLERGSMLWHKDDFGFKSLDLFVTISNLNFDNGPLYFLKKKNPLGVFAKIEEIIENPRPGERNKIEIDTFNKYYKETDTDVLIGKPGDALFIDSCRTYHRGGYCKSNNRLMLRITYQTPDNIRKSVLKDEFIKDHSTYRLEKNIFTRYAYLKELNFFLNLINIKKCLMFFYRTLHFKMNLKNIQNLFTN